MTARERREAWEAVAFLSPWIIGFVLFIGGPIVASFVMSFYRWDPSDLDNPRQFPEFNTAMTPLHESFIGIGTPEEACVRFADKVNSFLNSNVF